MVPADPRPGMAAELLKLEAPKILLSMSVPPRGTALETRSSVGSACTPLLA